MTIPNTFVRRAVAVVSALALLATVSAAQQPNAAPLSSSQRRALLTNPANAFWKTKAPDTATVDVETSRGVISIQLVRVWAPVGVDRFYNLARAGYFDDSRFYRVVPGYVAQFGLAGSPTVASLWRRQKLRPDSVRTSNVRGTVTFAQYDPKDRATDVFINLRDNPDLDTLGFAPIGRVIEGMDVADSLYKGYDDVPTMPPPVGNPRRLYGESNKYLDKEFPKLDRVVAAKVRP